MANDIGNVTGIRGTSTELNTQPGQGADKPSFSGKENPGDTKPPMPKERTVEMPK